MTQARKKQINYAVTRSYNLTGRCVRRAYLAGVDELTGKNHDYRRDWIIIRIKQLATVFSVDIASYAIMSNHYHLVVKVNVKQANSWTSREVVEQRELLYKTHPLVEQYLNSGNLSKPEKERANAIISQYRTQLASISEYMKALNEFIARKANKEDGCTGHFWESRFKSQAVLDDVSVLATMVYADLNPIRAKMADTPEGSDFTSIQERIREHQGNPVVYQLPEEEQENDPLKGIKQAKLLPFAGAPHIDNDPHHLQHELVSYICLVEWTGRLIKEGKRGKIPSDLPPILQRLNITAENWLEFSYGGFKNDFHAAIGNDEALTEFKHKTFRQYVKDTKAARQFYKPAELSQ